MTLPANASTAPLPLLLLGLLGLLGLAAEVAAAPKKPHVLFIIADDHGFHDASFTGSHVRTPTIDRLRSRGVALQQHYVQKVCSPTRTAVMTGRYPHRNGMQTPFCGGMAEGLNLNETMMPEHMNTAGVSRVVLASAVCLFRNSTPPIAAHRRRY